MSKRVLSLFLALVMLVLAVPVFALPTLADEADPTVNFAVGPTGKNGLNTVGTVVKTTTLSEKGFPTPADIEAAGVDLDLDEVIGWYAYDKAADIFRNVKAYYYGYRTLTDGLTFYPVTKTTYMQGFKNGYPLLPGANQPLWTATVQKDGNGAITGYAGSEVNTYIGGWTIGSYYKNSYKPFDVVGENKYALFTGSSGQSGGAYYPTGGDVWTTAPTSDYAMTFVFHAVATGTVKITIPGINMAGCTLAIAQNGSYVWPTSIKGQTATAAASDANKASWGALTHTHADPAKAGVASDLYKEEYITDTLTLDVKAGDQIHFMLAKAAANSPYFYPTVSYTNIEAVPVNQYMVTFASPNTAGNVVTPVHSFYSNEQISYPSAEELQRVLSMTANDIMGWYTHDKATDSWVSAEIILKEPITSDLVFYPITWNSSFGVNSNSILYNTDNTYYEYRGGWTVGRYSAKTDVLGNAFASYSAAKVDNYWILSPGTNCWYSSGIRIQSLSFTIPGNSYIEGVPALSWTAMANGTVDVSIPALSGENPIAVVHNNVYIYPEALKGQAVGNPLASANTLTSYAPASSPVMIEGVEVNALDNIAVLVLRGTSSEAVLTPTITYQVENRGTPVLYHSSFLQNRPTNINTNITGKVAGDSVVLETQGNWDYIAYTSKNFSTASMVPLTKRYWTNNSESWLVGANEINQGSSGFVNCNTTESPTATWPGFAMGIYRGKVVGTRYIAEYSGTINVSLDRLLTGKTNSANNRLTLDYAIFVGGEKVWPIGESAWHRISYYGNDIPEDKRGADSVACNTNQADILNASMPTVAVEVAKGESVEFLIYGVDLATYSTETGEFTTGAYWNQYHAHWNYMDGVVTYASIAEDPVPPAYETAFLDNRPQNIDYNLSGVGASELITYRGGWDYITYPTGDRGYAEPLTKRLAITATEEWYLAASGSNYYSPAVNANAASSEASPTSYWPGYGIIVPRYAMMGTRYTAEYNGPIKLSFDRVMSTTDPGAAKRLTLGYAIYVGGEKVWPAGDDWYKVAYYGSGIPAEEAGIVASGKQAYNALVAYNSTTPVNLADTINATLPTDLYVNKGEKIEFLVKGIDLENYTAPTEEGESGTYATASYSGNASRGNYVDGKVLFIRKDSVSAPQTPPTTSFATQKPYLNLNADQSKSAVFSANWDYVVYANMTALQSGHAGNSLSQRTVNGSEGWLVQPGDYAENVAGCNLNSPAYVYFSASNKHGASLSMWADGTIGFHSTTALAGTRYTAEYNGIVNISFSELSNWQNGTNKNTHTYAIYQNGKQIWPVDSEGEPADWYTLAYGYTSNESEYAASYGVNYAETVNDTMPSELYVQKGDTIEFLVAASPEIKDQYYSRSNVVDGVVEYTKIYTTPTAQAGVRVDGELSIYGVPVNVNPYNEYGVYINGVKIRLNELYKTQFAHKVAASKAGATQKIQPYYVQEGHQVLGEIYEITLKGLLEDYRESGNESIKAAAEATLNYTAAADAYFNDEVTEAPEIVAPAGKDAYVEKSEGIGVSEYEGENKIKFRGISLLLNDLVNIKIVVDGTLPEGATLQISKSASFDELETLISGKATDDGTGTKFVMNGISAQNWNTDYYIRVVDADKNVISDTLCYSVAAYYGRMIDRAEASDKLKAVISSLMNLYEAVSAN